jgi:hypothetical protein
VHQRRGVATIREGACKWRQAAAGTTLQAALTCWRHACA